jgi:sulfite reductase alpha subunit-like flavoprotein
MRNLIHTFAPHYPGDRRLQLFFGCRFHDKDYLFASDWKKLADDDKLDIVCAFSRDPNGGYVQDRIFADAKRVVELVVDRDGIFYVCGSAGKMPRQVRITLRAAIAQEKGWPEEEAEAFVKELERTGRYLQETW